MAFFSELRSFSLLRAKYKFDYVEFDDVSPEAKVQTGINKTHIFNKVLKGFSHSIVENKAFQKNDCGCLFGK